MIKVDYTDERGLKRRVRLKNEYEDPTKGIPIDIFTLLDEFYSDMSDTFRKSLYERLWAMGLIELHDCKKPTAKKMFRQALQSTLARDATDAIRYITEQEHDISSPDK